MFVHLLRFDWRDVAERFEQTLFVEPIDPLQCFPFDLIFGLPRPEAGNGLSFEQADNRLGQRIVIAVIDAADGRFQPGIDQPLCVLDRYVLRPASRMMDQLLSRPARMDCLFERIQNKLRVLCCRCLPTHDAVCKGIDDKSHVDEPMPGGHKREVGHLKLVWHRSPELAINLVQRALIRRLSMGGFDLLTPPKALNAKLAHQTFDGTEVDINLLALHGMPKLACAVDRPVLLPNVPHLLGKKRIPLGTI